MAVSRVKNPLCWGLFVVAPYPVLAQETLWDDISELNPRISLFADAEFTDNARKTANNEKSELTIDGGVDIGYEYQARAVEFDINYRLLHQAFRDDTFDNRTRINGGANLILSTNPARYSWVVNNRQDFGLVDSRRVNTPDNDSQRNTWATGPNANLRLTKVDTLALNARYIDTQYDDADSDSNRVTAGASWQHRLNKTHTISLNANWADAEFDNSQSDYEQLNYGFGLTGQTRLANYNIEAGLSDIERESGDDIDGEYFRLTLSRSWSGHSLQLAANHEVTDSSIGLSLNDFDDGLSNGDQNFESEDIVTRDRVQLNYTRRGGNDRIRLRAGLSYDQEDYEETLRDEERAEANFGFGYAFSSNFKSDLLLRYTVTEYNDEPLLGKDKNSYITLRFTHNVGPALDLNYRLAYEERNNSDDPLREYDAVIASVGLDWRFR